MIDLETWATRDSDTPPDPSEDTCRTKELWLRRLPKGTFVMGSPENELGRVHDEVQYKVTLTQDYFMGVFPVTQWQWERVMGKNPSKCKRVGPCAPVDSVSYDDICGEKRPWPADASVSADSFLGRLRAKTGLRGLDLPTEAQWEYACRAGTTSALNNGKELTSEDGICPNLDEVAWYNGNSDDKSHPVGEKKPNAWGLYDMHGNVWEWCRDWEGSYSGDATDPTGAQSGSDRMMRGGSWGYGNSPRICRSADRGYCDPSYGDSYSGFRVVCLP